MGFLGSHDCYRLINKLVFVGIKKSHFIIFISFSCDWTEKLAYFGSLVFSI